MSDTSTNPADDTTTDTAQSSGTGAPDRGSVFQRLYTGTGAFNIVGHRKYWLGFFAALLIACITIMGVKGFNLGIEFEGGTQLQLPAQGATGEITTEDVQDPFVDALDQPPSETQKVGSGDGATIQIRSETLDAEEVAQVKQSLFEQLQPVDAEGSVSKDAISDDAVSASWGGEISQKALIALAVFLALVAVFLIIYFEKWMAVSALAALLHDVIVTAGLYSLIGFEVSPATAIGLLTILGYSLYDTVVVFDKVKENTRGLLHLTRRTYPEAANLALNQTLMRSINTSVIALLPVGAMLIIGYLILGSGVLPDLALVLATGMIAGTISSVLMATPLLTVFKMREQRFREQAERVRQRREGRTRQPVPPESEDFDVTDDEALATELRQEKAYAAAAGVPVRHPKAQRSRSSRAERTGSSTQQRTGRPTGKRGR